MPPSLVFVGVGFRPLFGLLLLGAGRGATVLAGGTVFPRCPLLCCCCFHFEMLVAPPDCVLTPWGFDFISTWRFTPGGPTSLVQYFHINAFFTKDRATEH